MLRPRQDLSHLDYLERRFHIIDVFYVKLKASMEQKKKLTHDEIATLLMEPFMETHALEKKNMPHLRAFLYLRDTYDDYYNLFLKQMEMKHNAIRDILKRCLVKLKRRFVSNDKELRDLLTYMSQRDLSFQDQANYYDQYKRILSAELKRSVSPVYTPSPEKEALSRRASASSASSASRASPASHSMASASSARQKVKAALQKLPPVKKS